MKRKSQTRARSVANQLRRSKLFRVVQSRPVVGPSPSEVAAICQVSLTTAKGWLSGKTRIPRHAVVLLTGDLGAMDPGWQGWRVEKDRIVSPKGWMISRSDLESAPILMEEIAELRQALGTARRCNSLEEQPLPGSE